MERSIGGSNNSHNSSTIVPSTSATSSKSKGKQKAKDQHLTWVGEGIGGFSVNLLGHNGSNLPESKNERSRRVNALEERMRMVEERVQLEKLKSPVINSSSSSSSYSLDSICPKMLAPPISSSSISLQDRSRLNSNYVESKCFSNDHLYDIIGGQGIVMESTLEDKKKKEDIYQQQLLHMEEMFNYQERRRAALKASGSSMSPSQERESRQTIQHQQELQERRRNSTPTLVTTSRPSTGSSSGSNSTSSRPSTGSNTTTNTSRRQSEPVNSSLQARRSSATSSSSKFALSQEPNSTTQYLPLPIARVPTQMFQLKPKAFSNLPSNSNSNQFIPPPPSPASNYIPSNSSISSDITNNHRRSLSNQSTQMPPLQSSQSHARFPDPAELHHPQPQKFEFKLPQAYPSPQAQTVQCLPSSSLAPPSPHYNNKNYTTPSNYVGSPSTNLDLFGNLNSNSNENISNYLSQSLDSKSSLNLINSSNTPYNVNYDPLALNFQKSNEFRAQNELYDTLLGINNDSTQSNSGIVFPLPIPSHSSNQSHSRSQSHSSFPNLNQPSPAAAQSQFINYPSPTNSIIDRRGSINSNHGSIPRVEEQQLHQGNYGFNYNSGSNLNRLSGAGGENSLMTRLDNNGLVSAVGESGPGPVLDGNSERSSKRRKEF